MFKKTIKGIIDTTIEEINRSDKGKVTAIEKEIAELKLQKRLEEEEIKHLVKMKEEKNSIEVEKKLIAMQKDFGQREMDLLKKYQEDILARFKKEQENLQAVYTEIMKRLPTINVDVKR